MYMVLDSSEPSSLNVEIIAKRKEDDLGEAARFRCISRLILRSGTPPKMDLMRSHFIRSSIKRGSRVGFVQRLRLSRYALYISRHNCG
jgi:hypothetical protein